MTLAILYVQRYWIPIPRGANDGCPKSTVSEEDVSCARCFLEGKAKKLWSDEGGAGRGLVQAETSQWEGEKGLLSI